MIICMHTFTIWLNMMALWKVTKIMTRLRRTHHHPHKLPHNLQVICF